MLTEELRNNSWFRNCHFSNIPKKFINSKLDDFRILGKNKEKKLNQESLKSVKLYIENLEENIINGKGIILCGPFGVGKTMLLSIIAMNILKSLSRVNAKIRNEKDIFENKSYFILANTLIDLVFRSNLTDKELKMRSKIKDISALFIDDLLKFKKTKSEVELDFLDEILRTRHHNNLITCMTIQVGSSELDKWLPENIIELLENFVVLNFVGDSQRGK